MNIKEKKELAYTLLNSFLPLVSFQPDELINERERMLINAKECSRIAIDLTCNILDAIEEREKGVFGYKYVQNDLRDALRIIENETYI